MDRRANPSIHPTLQARLRSTTFNFLFLTRSPHCHFLQQFHLFGFYVLSDVSYLFFLKLLLLHVINTFAFAC